MSLENVFYFVGIICMTLYTILLVVILGVMIYIKRKISELQEELGNKFQNVREMIDNPKQAAALIGAAAAEKAIDKTVTFFKSRKKKNT